MGNRTNFRADKKESGSSVARAANTLGALAITFCVGGDQTLQEASQRTDAHQIAHANNEFFDKPPGSLQDVVEIEQPPFITIETSE